MTSREGEPRRPRRHPILLGMGVLALVVLHGLALYYGASRVSLPVAIVGGVIAMVVTVHLLRARR